MESENPDRNTSGWFRRPNGHYIALGGSLQLAHPTLMHTDSSGHSGFDPE